MARFDDEPDIELTGHLSEPYSTPSAWYFEADTWTEPEWLPKSQTTWVADETSTERAGNMFIKAWLAKKNGWSE